MTRPDAPLALTLLGAASLAGAAVCGDLAWLHMRWTAETYGAICGQGALAHCPACPAAVALLIAGLSFLAAAASARLRTSKVRSAGR